MHNIYIMSLSARVQTEDGNFVTKHFRTGEAYDFIDATEEFYVGRK